MIHAHRSRTPLGVLAAIGLLLLAACGTSSIATTPPPSAATLLQQSSDNFNKDNFIHFTLVAENIAPGAFAVTQATGDVARPDKMKITGTDEVTQGFQAPVGLVFIGSDQYVDLGGSGKYTKTGGLPNLLAIFDPNDGIGAILTQVQNPSTPVAENLGNSDTWKITGTVPSTTLAPIVGSSPSATVVPIQTIIWVGQADLQVHQVKLVGKAIDGDVDNTARIFTLSNFNVPVTIAVPPLK